jgi:TonB-dependent receptor-like protein
MERMDYRISDKDSFYGRYVYDPSSAYLPTTTLPDFVNTIFDVSHFVVLSETHVFSGASLNEFRAGFQRTDPGQNSSPAVQIDPSLSFVPGQPFGTIEYNLTATAASAGQLALLGTFRQAPQHFAQNIFQESDAFSIVRGAHSLKFGADVQRIQINLFQGSYSRGDYLFGGLQSLMAGLPTRFNYLLTGTSTSAQSRGWRNNMFGFFGQDDFRVRPNLTLNLGLRYEFQTAPGEVNGRSGNLMNPTDLTNVPGPPFVPSKLNFSPRFGLAWDPTGSGKTSVRFGAGMYQNQVLGRLWFYNANQDSDYLKSYVISPAPWPHALVNGLPVNALQANYFSQYHLDTPTAINYNLDVQRQLAPSLSLRVGYVGSFGYHWTRTSSENLRIPTILSDGTKFYSSTAPLRNPNFSDMPELKSDATYLSNGMQVMLQKALSAGLQFQLSYTLSLATSDADENGLGLATPIVAQDSQRLGLDHSLSAYDQRHTLVLNGVYQMPWEKRLNGRLAKSTLGGWAVNGIFSYNTGTPGTILTGYNTSQTTDRYAPDRPNLAPGASNNPTSGVTAGCPGIPAGQKLGTANRWFDPCAFNLQPNGFYGNLGRNTLIGPGLTNLDFTLVKTTPLTEHKRLEFRAEFFNILNHANFAMPNLSAFNSSRNYSGNAGIIAATSTANRQIQLGMKLIF